MKFRVGFETRFQMVPLWFFFFRKFSISFLGLEFSLPVLPSPLPLVIFLTTLILVQANCKVVYDLCSRLPYLWKLNRRRLKVMMHDRIRQFFHYLFNGSEKLRPKDTLAPSPAELHMDGPVRMVRMDGPRTVVWVREGLYLGQGLGTIPKTIILSELIIVLSRCAIVKTVQCSNSELIVCWITESVFGSTFAVASSTNRIELFLRIALPRHSSCFWPTLKRKLTFWP